MRSKLKKWSRSRIEHGVLRKEKKWVPHIFHDATAFLLKIFPSSRTKNSENTENVKSPFSILCVFKIIFSENIFYEHNITYFQVYFSFSLKMEMKMGKPNTTLYFLVVVLISSHRYTKRKRCKKPKKKGEKIFL